MRARFHRYWLLPGRGPNRGLLHRRPVAGLAAIALVLAAAAATAGVVPRLPVAAARADDVTASQNDLRTGWDPAEPHLAPASDGGPVGGASFGQLFSKHLNGQIYAQPLVVGDVLIVATETNHVYGLNAATGAVEWADSLGKPEPWTGTGCTNVKPDIGITSPPVYDPASEAVYVVALVDNGPSTVRPHMYTYALSVSTGHVLPGWPVAISGHPVNAPADSFNPLTERQRAGLLLLGGSIYIAFASYCDYLPYAGYVAGVSTSTRRLTLWTDEAGLTQDEAGIWQGGGGLMSDGPGRIFLATGNGVSPPAGPGTSPPPQLGDSVVRLSVAANGTLSAADFFSPANAPTLDADDEDFGSGGPVGLPFGTRADPALLVQAGKDGRVFVLNRDNLGGREQGPGGTDHVLAETGPFGGQWGHPGVFGPTASLAAASTDDFVYYVGNSDVMRYLRFGATASGAPTITDVADSTTSFGYTSGSPVVTSDGNNPASAVVWEVYSAGISGADGSLEAFAAEPPKGCTVPCAMAPIWSAPIGTAAQFSIPATDDGRVYVGTRNGNIVAFGSPDSAPLTASPVNFGAVPVGGYKYLPVTVTAARRVKVRSVSAVEPSGSAPFRVAKITRSGRTVRFPVVLRARARLTVLVSYKPTVPGGVTGALRFKTSDASMPVVSLSLTGQGTAPGLHASVGEMSFRAIPEGTRPAKLVTITNDSTVSETISGTASPVAPFSARLPVAGRVLRPGQSVGVSVSFRSAATALSRSSFSISTSGGHRLSVKLKGDGIRAVSRLVARPATVGFGSVRLGTGATKTIVVTNTGNLVATVGSVAAPQSPFGAQALVPAGLPVVPGYQLRVPVTFSPSSTGTVSSRYLVHWRDATGRHTLTVLVSGTGVAAAKGRRAVPPPGGGWTLNGDAAMSGRQLLLTRSGTGQAGSAVYPVPQTAAGLTVSFTALLHGAAGLTVGLLAASSASPSALGGHGAQFGFGGLGGVAVTLAAGGFPGDPSGSFAGVAVSKPGSSLRYAATTIRVPDLTAGSHRVKVAVRGRRVRLYVSGKQVLTAVLSPAELPGRVLVAFTGGTGTLTGSASASSVSVGSGRASLPPPGGGWSFNGSALMSGSATQLTRVGPAEAGSVVYPAAVPTVGLIASFTAELYGGSGADGMTLALLNPATSGATSLGGDGTSDGFGGLGGVAIGLDTDMVPYVGSNSAYLAEGTAGSAFLDVLQRAEAFPPLRPGPNSVTVKVSRSGRADLVTVWLAGEQIIQQRVRGLPASVLLAFTGSTGTGTDIHLVRDVTIGAAG